MDAQGNLLSHPMVRAYSVRMTQCEIHHNTVRLGWMNACLVGVEVPRPAAKSVELGLHEGQMMKIQAITTIY